MLSYRHSYHAGNYADVLKHMVLIECLKHMTAKDKPFSYIDTHAGAGLYALTSAQASKLEEYRNGIGKLWGNAEPLLQPYLTTIRRYNKGQALRYYPGSPLIAAQFLRPQDQAWCYELHPNDSTTLATNCKPFKKCRVKPEDGLQGLISLLPPVSRRALVLIDPSYEVKTDYQLVVKTIAQAHRRFATGTYALWYPVVKRAQIQQMEKALKQTGIRNIQLFELGLTGDTDERGMTASGMIVINPPWTLQKAMTDVLPLLQELLSDSTSTFRNEVLQPE